MSNDSKTAPHQIPGAGWEDPGCPVCGNHQRDTLLQAQVCPPGGNSQEVSIVRCGGCGFTYTAPRPDQNLIGSFYSSDYKPHQTTRKTSKKEKGKSAARFGELPERKGMAPFGEARLLDFGCGSGSYLVRMKAQGWTVTGIDASPTMAKTLTDQGWEVLHGSLPHPGLEGRLFEVITMWHSLEHVHDPVAVLKAAEKLLVPGGKLVVAVPAFDSWNFKAFGRDWLGLDLPIHLSHFTAKSLGDVAIRAGLVVDNIGRLNHSSWMRQSAINMHKRLGSSTPFWAKLLRNRTFSSLWASLVHRVKKQSDVLILRASKTSRIK